MLVVLNLLFGVCPIVCLAVGCFCWLFRVGGWCFVVLYLAWIVFSLRGFVLFLIVVLF